MKIEIDTVRNGFLLEIKSPPTIDDPLAENRKHGGTWFCRDTTDLLGRIAAAVMDVCGPVQDRLERD